MKNPIPSIVAGFLLVALALVVVGTHAQAIAWRLSATNVALSATVTIDYFPDESSCLAARDDIQAEIRRELVDNIVLDCEIVRPS